MKCNFFYFLVLLVILITQCNCQDLEVHELLKLRKVNMMDSTDNKEFSKNATQELSEQWENYYQCQKKDSQYMQNRYTTAENVALAAFEGSHVTITCKVCLSPRQSVSDISWHIMVDQETQPLNITGTDLHFDNVAIQQQGIYLCKFVSLARQIYWLHVLHEPNEPFKQVHLHQDPRALEEVHFSSEQGELRVFSQWGEWSNCSEAHHCGQVGRRLRYGPCMLSFTDTKQHEKKVSAFMQLFPKGLPCRSSLVPLNIRSMNEIQQRPTEIILGYCKVMCNKNANSTFKVWDNLGHLVDKVDNAAGFYSSLQDIPKLPPPPDRLYIFPYDGDQLTIKCPGHKLSDSPVQWHKGHKHLASRELKKSTEGRITINILGQMVFKSMHLKDTNIYSCWQEGRLVGSVKLKVMKREVVMSKLHWSLFMAATVLTTLLLAMYRIYKK